MRQEPQCVLSAAQVLLTIDGIKVRHASHSTHAVTGGAPPLMMLGVDNSMHDKASGDFTMCRLTLFAPYWVDNRSGLDLLFKDGPSAKGHPLLMGAHTYFDYAPVKAPGTSFCTELF